MIFMLCSVKSLVLVCLFFCWCWRSTMLKYSDTSIQRRHNTTESTVWNLQCDQCSQIPKQMVLLSRLFLVNNFVCLCFMKNTKEILLNSKSITELMCHTYLTTSYYFCVELLYYLGFVGFKSVFLMTDCAFHNHSKD